MRAGVPQIMLATQDLFVPQTANFDLVGGISFRKGCYPGQEIVARMQYLGRLKERMFAFEVEGPPPAPAARVVRDGDNVGTVVNAAAAPGGGCELPGGRRTGRAAGELRLRLADGRTIAQFRCPTTSPRLPRPIA